MSSVPIVFRFQDDGAAALAYDTLLEIGYHAHQDEQEGQWIVQVFVDHSELTSALEIAQAHGGELLLLDEGTTGDEDDDSGVFTGGDLTDAAGGQLFNTAYGLDMISIPAHLVNEDEVADTTASD
ncbi:DNA/RNA helicase [Paenibacillus sp. FSL H8-0034]|uniref:DNA/RNA helicase n=1 Tax=Paenibacillus sp. FSL H8-0034 TaxID=2954671 RepID=UPI0030F82284